MPDVDLTCVNSAAQDKAVKGMSVVESSIENPDELTYLKPPVWLRPAIAQTAIASQKFRARGTNPVVDKAQEIILTSQDGVHLSGSYSPNSNSRGLAIFLHGWEGSANSTYVLSCSRFLYKAGLSVFRLNFRDHGDTHHLNEELFHSARLDEVLEAVLQAANLEAGKPVYLIGFSLGGNFALRIARALSGTGQANLRHIFSISPVIDPCAASPKVDDSPLIRRYFYKKWTRSLLKKQAAYPDLYDFSAVLKHKTVMGITHEFLPKYTEFDKAVDYFNAYRIGVSDLANCDLPVSIIMAKDDPVLPAEHVNTLQLSENVRKILLDYGGHNGFFQSLMGPTWYDAYILNHLDS